ncbi:ABC transporter permease subunit [Zongyangia hominis]|uniref:Beta-methylgalactoside transporter n=1 Tax=Zongyangia hominis TaxID=2763677 RepID=A0A926EFJ2_9FIRM|nr:beta-methylgalactoside transporter [Zongyangia hominis]MBC8571239.1 beta-methylgalactoside transporter [Zongyangia hominis]
MGKSSPLTAIKVKRFVYNNALMLVLAVGIVVIAILNPQFIQIRVVKDILTQSAVKLLVALGLMFPLLTGGTDLAGGRQVGLAAVLAASMMQTAAYSSRFFPGLPQIPVIVPILIVAVVLAVVGFFNGLMVAKLSLPPFIATLGMSTIVYGANLLYFGMEPNSAQPIGGLRDDFTFLAQHQFFGQINILIVIAAVFVVIVWFVLNKTTYGRMVYAVGGNPKAAKVAGINVVLILISVYVIESILVGFAGVLEAARTMSAQASYGTSYEFDAISACVVGGVSLSGGVGKVSGVVLGVIIFTVINYGLAFIGVNPNWQLIIRGLIICAAVAFDVKKATI